MRTHGSRQPRAGGHERARECVAQVPYATLRVERHGARTRGVACSAAAPGLGGESSRATVAAGALLRTGLPARPPGEVTSSSSSSSKEGWRPAAVCGTRKRDRVGIRARWAVCASPLGGRGAGRQQSMQRVHARATGTCAVAASGCRGAHCVGGHTFGRRGSLNSPPSMVEPAELVRRGQVLPRQGERRGLGVRGTRPSTFLAPAYVIRSGQGHALLRAAHSPCLPTRHPPARLPPPSGLTPGTPTQPACASASAAQPPSRAARWPAPDWCSTPWWRRPRRSQPGAATPSACSRPSSTPPRLLPPRRPVTPACSTSSSVRTWVGNVAAAACRVARWRKTTKATKAVLRLPRQTGPRTRWPPQRRRPRHARGPWRLCVAKLPGWRRKLGWKVHGGGRLTPAWQLSGPPTWQR